MLKKKTINSIILTVVMFMASFQIEAQRNYSLEELIRISLEQNYQLQIVRNQQQMAENQNTAGNAGMLPSVNAGAQRSWQILNTETNFFTGDSRSGSNALNTSLNAFIEMDWTVFDGFSMFARRDRLGYLAQLGELDTKYWIEQTVSDIAFTFYQLIREQLLLESYRQSLEISAFRLNLEDQKRRVGTGNALRYHLAVIDFNADSSLVSNQQMRIRDLQIQINRIVNFDPSQEIHPSIKNIDLQGLSNIDNLLEKALINNQELERAKLEEMIAEANLRIEKGNRYPQLSIFGGYSFNRQTSELGFVESSRNYGGDFGVRVRFNLYDGGRQNIRIRNSLLDQENSAIGIQDTRALLYSEISRFMNMYENYMSQYRLLQQSLESAGRTLEIARQQLETGTISGFDFRQTQLAALQVENQIINLKFSMKAIEIDIFRLTGELPEIIF
ncbi:MAG: TolC family protein [Bacteroidetes bacterium]|nr:MAG: TolC family protein [Bacteroidota bacterium]